MTATDRTFAQRWADDRRAERDRVRELNRPVEPGPHGEDHGMDLGPAALARPKEVIRVGGRINGAAQRKAAPVNAVKLADATLFDRLHYACQINDRQHAAGVRLHKLWVAAGLDPRTTARYPVVPMHDPDEEPHEPPETDLREGETPLDHHRRVMRQLPSYQAAILDAACLGQHPGVRFLATLQAALDALADHWRIPRSGS